MLERGMDGWKRVNHNRSLERKYLLFLRFSSAYEGTLMNLI